MYIFFIFFYCSLISDFLSFFALNVFQCDIDVLQCYFHFSPTGDPNVKFSFFNLWSLFLVKFIYMCLNFLFLELCVRFIARISLRGSFHLSSNEVYLTKSMFKCLFLSKCNYIRKSKRYQTNLRLLEYFPHTCFHDFFLHVVNTTYVWCFFHNSCICPDFISFSFLLITEVYSLKAFSVFLFS